MIAIAIPSFILAGIERELKIGAEVTKAATLNKAHINEPIQDVISVAVSTVDVILLPIT